MKPGWMLVVLLGAGCATSEGYQRDTSSWIGRSKGELITAWGQPDSDTSIPPGFHTARRACMKSGVGWFMEVEAAAEALKRCAERTIAEWNWGSITYSRNETRSYPGRAPTYHGTIVGNEVTLTPSGGSESGSEYRFCHTTFEVRDNVIVGVASTGNHCKG
jgi:hypothetical protein